MIINIFLYIITGILLSMAVMDARELNTRTAETDLCTIVMYVFAWPLMLLILVYAAAYVVFGRKENE